MTTIELTAQGTTAWVKLRGTLTAGTVGAVVKITCSREWEGLRKILKFRCGGEECQREVTADELTVPTQCLVAGCRLEIALDGWDGAGTLRIPTGWANCALVLPSAAAGEEEYPEPPENVTAQLLSRVDEVEKKVEAFAESDAATAKTDAAPRVYCWGDSLTQGEGGNLKLTDGVFNAFNLHPYTDELTDYRAVNLGCRGEDITTIMARQGADPMTVGGFTIPADRTAVIVGNKNDGIPTVSGGVAKPLNPMEAGINPCTIAGVRGILHRGSSKDDTDDNYYFTRLTPGDAVQVPENTQVETFAMTHYRGGIAVIWMGANGGWSSHTDFIVKVQKMVKYGAYSNYLVLLCREFSQDYVDQIAAALTDERGICHVLNLYRELSIHGLTLANMTHYYFDTSDYANGDEILLKAPVLCSCYQDEDGLHFEHLHFSAYGYKAIGKLVAAKLAELLDEEDSGDGDTDGDAGNTPDENAFETNVTDEFGTILCRLKSPYTSDGTQALDTGWAPYDEEKNWTIAIKVSDHITGDSVFRSIFESRDDVAGTSLFFRKETLDGETYLNVNMGKRMGFPFKTEGGFFEWVGGDFSDDGYHYLVLSKNGDSYVVAFDGGVWDGYGAALDGATSQRTITLFARREDNGELSQFAATTILDFRIYDGNFGSAKCKEILESMKE